MRQEIAICMQAQVPFLLSGEPGTEKTATVKSVARALGYHEATIGMPQRFDPGDFAMPYMDTKRGRVLKSPCAEIAEINAACGDGDPGILFLDEIFDTSRASQSLAMRLVHERRIDDIVLAPSVTVGAAGNPAACNASGQGLPKALQNRFCHIDVGRGLSTPQEWADNLLTGFSGDASVPVLGKDWRDRLPDAYVRVAAFIRVKPALLHAMPTDDETMAWPSRRSWHTFSVLLAACKASRSDHLLPNLAVGMVGQGAGVEFVAWERSLDLPDPEELLKDPKKLKVDGTRQDILFAVASSVVGCALDNKPGQDRWLKAWQVLARIADAGVADVAAAAARRLAKGRQAGWVMPTQELKPFVPLLKKAGLI